MSEPNTLCENLWKSFLISSKMRHDRWLIRTLIFGYNFDAYGNLHSGSHVKFNLCSMASVHTLRFLSRGLCDSRRPMHLLWQMFFLRLVHHTSFHDASVWFPYCLAANERASCARSLEFRLIKYITKKYARMPNPIIMSSIPMNLFVFLKGFVMKSKNPCFVSFLSSPPIY